VIFSSPARLIVVLSSEAPSAGGVSKEESMKRLGVITVASALVLGLAPASALARHHHKRHHHARVHHRAHIRHKRFGNISTPPATSTTPTTPGMPPADAVGTVDSFSGGTLTIKLNNGSTVSGTVDSSTELECEAAEPADNSTIHEDGDGGGDHSGSGDNGGSGGDDQGSGDDDQGDDQGENNQCTTADLTPGAFVRGAELRISSAGEVWDKVDLIL
jgi:hypothetical protein